MSRCYIYSYIQILYITLYYNDYKEEFTIMKEDGFHQISQIFNWEAKGAECLSKDEVKQIKLYKDSYWAKNTEDCKYFH